ncbi:hemolysin family protein [Asanoa sp. WMMD1127]|uniref:hemolysin family protein n=1 Tax=Asanoa sp. WMMD1127 TaxID=3016107 RepID=UPI0024164C60|nr:hemolysin family protein [Asanoa sp. WMMD1127]MDG4822759.1 hemolysin family protein [Asanoa sp. WMMD1127]
MQDQPGTAGPRRRGPTGRPQRNPGPVARRLARLVVRTADGLTAALGADPSAGREQISEADLRDLVAASTRLDPVERRIIDEVLVARDTMVREVMRPRTEVTFLSARQTLVEAAERARAETHTRYPVVDGTHDDVVGFVHLRDLLIRPEGDGRVTIGELTREVKRIPASKRVLVALTEMRRERHHLAVVIDEYGGTAGIVTLEDLIEEVVGEIHDEYDVEPDPVPGRPTDLDGRLNLADFAERAGFALPPGPYETVGGYVMASLGRVPRIGDEAPVPGRDPDEGWVLRVLELDGRRVARVGIRAVEPPPPPPAPEAEAAQVIATIPMPMVPRREPSGSAVD